MIPNQLVTWLNRVHWIQIKWLWLNGENDGAGDRAPDGASPEVHRQRSGVHPRAREKAEKGEGVTVKLTRGLKTSGEHGRTVGDDDRRRESTGDDELGTGSVGVRPKAAEVVPHGPVNMGEGSG